MSIPIYEMDKDLILSSHRLTREQIESLKKTRMFLKIKNAEGFAFCINKRYINDEGIKMYPFLKNSFKKKTVVQYSGLSFERIN